MGRNIIDLTGKKFGRLTVLALSPDRDASGHTQWLCRCSCGTIVEVSQSNLVYGNTSSCGCLKRDMQNRVNHTKKGRPAINMIGKRFGRLTVIAPTTKREATNGNIIWKCQCDCGNVTYVNSASLRRGLTQSCGCLRNEKVSATKKSNKYIKNKKSYTVFDENGNKFIIDLEDKKKINNKYWSRHGAAKQFSTSKKSNNKTVHIPLWRAILDTDWCGHTVTFINGNKADYRKSNLKLGGYDF